MEGKTVTFGWGVLGDQKLPKKLELPSVKTVRKRIEQAYPEEAKYCFMAGYLFCARISEIVGRTYPSDLQKTLARGPKGSEVRTDVFEQGDLKEEVAIFLVSTAKRGGLVRKIALPLNRKYEPFTEQLLEYFRERKNRLVFPFTRQKAWGYSTKVFDGLAYPIEQYMLYEYRNGVQVDKTPIKRHDNLFRTHALRHIRAAELIEFYGFDGYDLSVYGGWTLRGMIGGSSAMSRYAHLRWQRYFLKLLKERRD